MNRFLNIAALVAFARADTTNSYQELNMGVFPNFQAQKINAWTGVKVNGASKFITSAGIMHAIKGHGNDKEESKRGQKGITDSDFERIPAILSDPDTVNKGIITGRGDQSIVFVKKINSVEFYVAMAVKKNKNGINLYFTTMYAKKTKKPMY